MTGEKLETAFEEKVSRGLEGTLARLTGKLNTGEYTFLMFIDGLEQLSKDFSQHATEYIDIYLPIAAAQARLSLTDPRVLDTMYDVYANQDKAFRRGFYNALRLPKESVERLESNNFFVDGETTSPQMVDHRRWAFTVAAEYASVNDIPYSQGIKPRRKSIASMILKALSELVGGVEL